MGNDNKLSVKAAVIYAIVVMVVAFLGVVAGNWFVEWRRGPSGGATIGDWMADNQTTFIIGDPFPNEQVYRVDGTVDSTASIVAGSKTLVLFISTGCKPCRAVVEDYTRQLQNIPDDLRIIAIANSDTAEVADYKAETGFPYEIYCDPEFLFIQQYDVTQFPSMVGIKEDGTVMFAVHGYREDFGPLDAYQKLSSQ